MASRAAARAAFRAGAERRKRRVDTREHDYPRKPLEAREGWQAKTAIETAKSRQAAPPPEPKPAAMSRSKPASRNSDREWARGELARSKKATAARKAKLAASRAKYEASRKKSAKKAVRKSNHDLWFH